MHRVFPPFVSGIGALGLLVLRIVTGLAFTMHGWGKIQSPGGPFHWMDQMPDAPPGPVQALAVLAEFGGGIALIVGIWRVWVALGSAVLLVLFGTAMAISFGIKSPLDYSVFSASSAALLVAAYESRCKSGNEPASHARA